MPSVVYFYNVSFFLFIFIHFLFGIWGAWWWWSPVRMSTSKGQYKFCVVCTQFSSRKHLKWKIERTKNEQQNNINMNWYFLFSSSNAHTLNRNIFQLWKCVCWQQISEPNGELNEIYRGEAEKKTQYGSRILGYVYDISTGYIVCERV